jgi:hypothetical protein
MTERLRTLKLLVEPTRQNGGVFMDECYPRETESKVSPLTVVRSIGRRRFSSAAAFQLASTQIHRLARP